MFSIDQSEEKAKCIAWMRQLGENSTELEISNCLTRIRKTSRKWNVDSDRLMGLIGSQLSAGNAAGAIKVIEQIPDKRFGLFS